MLCSDDPLPRAPQRVAVAGVSGVGKTTFAARIADVIGSPHIEIDALFHGPNWVPRAEFEQDVRAFTATTAWVTEWQGASARHLIAARADLLVWLDLPFFRVTLPRVLRRTVSRRLRRQELWNGNVEPPLRTFFTDPQYVVRWAVTTRHKYRDLVPRLEVDVPGLEVVRLRSSREAERWLRGPLAASVLK